MRTILVILTSTLIAVPALAHQMDKDPGMRMKQKLVQHLELNESQQAQLDSIFEAKKPQMLALREQMQALKQETGSEIEAILTEQQLEKFEIIKEKRMNHHQHRPSKNRM